MSLPARNIDQQGYTMEKLRFNMPSTTPSFICRTQWCSCERELFLFFVCESVKMKKIIRDSRKFNTFYKKCTIEVNLGEVACYLNYC